MASPPVLAFPYFERPIVVETDESAVAVVAVLTWKAEHDKAHQNKYAGEP